MERRLAMRTALKFMALLFVLIAVGCTPAGPPFASVAATLSPVPPGSARIYFYRYLEPYETIAETEAYLNGNPVGVTETGTVFYRDVTPGKYTISVRSDGVFPDQSKTVILKPGDVSYARVESIKSWVPCGGGGGGRSGGATEGCEDTFVVVMIDPTIAQADMRDLRYIPG
jgi:hypothetical protein